MNIIKRLLSKSLTRIVATSLLLSATAMPTWATIVVFETSQGDIEVNLFDESTPETVENFLSYVNDGSYINSIIHRSIPGFIIQGGGNTFEGELPLTNIASKPSVINEPVWSNQRGTIAMAKLGGNPNSASNQWFFNLSDNSANLDNQNGGFTAFGQVTDEGMVVVDKIASLNICSGFVMPDYDCAGQITPGVENFVSIYSLSISNTSKTSASDLTPVESKYVAPSDSGGIPLFSLLFLIGLRLLRQTNISNK